MAKQFWQDIKNFKPTEDWGNPDEMSYSLLLTLDALREHLRIPMYIHCGNQGKHSENSYHYIRNGSCAVDLDFRGWKKSVVDLVLEITRFNFTGIGYYPEWQHEFGFHLDIRPTDKGARWVQRKGLYLNMNFKTLTKPWPYKTNE